MTNDSNILSESTGASAAWYYATLGQAAGPVSHDQLSDLVRTGRVRPETLVWTAGLTAWRSWRAVSGEEGAEPWAQEPTGLQLSPPPLPAPPPTAPLVPPEKHIVHPWRRFFARLLDLLLWALPVSYAMIYLWPVFMSGGTKPLMVFTVAAILPLLEARALSRRQSGLS